MHRYQGKLFSLVLLSHSYPTRFALDLNWTVVPCKKQALNDLFVMKDAKFGINSQLKLQVIII